MRERKASEVPFQRSQCPHTPMPELRVPLSPAEQHFCFLIEADRCVRPFLLQELSEQTPETAELVGHMLMQCNALDVSSIISTPLNHGRLSSAFVRGSAEG